VGYRIGVRPDIFKGASAPLLSYGVDTCFDHHRYSDNGDGIADPDFVDNVWVPDTLVGGRQDAEDSLYICGALDILSELVHGCVLDDLNWAIANYSGEDESEKHSSANGTSVYLD